MEQAVVPASMQDSRRLVDGTYDYGIGRPVYDVLLPVAY